MRDKFEYNLTTKLLRAPKDRFIIRVADFHKYSPKRADDLVWDNYYFTWGACMPDGILRKDSVYARQNIYK